MTLGFRFDFTPVSPRAYFDFNWFHFDFSLRWPHKVKGKNTYSHKGKNECWKKRVTWATCTTQARRHACHDTKIFPGRTHPPTSDIFIFIYINKYITLTGAVPMGSRSLAAWRPAYGPSQYQNVLDRPFIALVTIGLNFWGQCWLGFAVWQKIGTHGCTCRVRDQWATTNNI